MDLVELVKYSKAEALRMRDLEERLNDAESKNHGQEVKDLRAQLVEEREKHDKELDSNESVLSSMGESVLSLADFLDKLLKEIKALKKSLDSPYVPIDTTKQFLNRMEEGASLVRNQIMESVKDLAGEIEDE